MKYLIRDSFLTQLLYEFWSLILKVGECWTP